MPDDRNDDDRRCPVCGQGVLRDLGTESPDEPLGPDASVRETYTCGHEVQGPPQEATAHDPDLEAERRETEDTVDPPN